MKTDASRHKKMRSVCERYMTEQQEHCRNTQGEKYTVLTSARSKTLVARCIKHLQSLSHPVWFYAPVENESRTLNVRGNCCQYLCR